MPLEAEVVLTCPIPFPAWQAEQESLRTMVRVLSVPGTDKTRTIVLKDSCSACHAGKGIGHVSTTSASNGIPAGSFVGRNNPNFCVTCHTDQTKFGFAPVTTTATGYSGAY